MHGLLTGGKLPRQFLTSLGCQVLAAGAGSFFLLTRFLVLPLRPAGTEGWSEEQLAELVTRDSMVGTGLARSPDETTA